MFIPARPTPIVDRTPSLTRIRTGTTAVLQGRREMINEVNWIVSGGWVMTNLAGVDEQLHAVQPRYTREKYRDAFRRVGV